MYYVWINKRKDDHALLEWSKTDPPLLMYSCDDLGDASLLAEKLAKKGEHNVWVRHKPFSLACLAPLYHVGHHPEHGFWVWLDLRDDYEDSQ